MNLRRGVTVDRGLMLSLTERIGERNLRLYLTYQIAFAIAAYAVFAVCLTGGFFIVAGWHKALFWLEIPLAIAALPISVAIVAFVRAIRGIARMYGLPMRATWDMPLSRPSRFDDWVARHGGEKSPTTV
jgi:hypothetical protein